MKKILIFLFLINVLLGLTACSKHEHIIEIKEGFEPTCELNGEITHYYCINCNKIFNDSKGTTELNGVFNSYQKSIQKYIKLYKSIHYF